MDRDGKSTHLGEAEEDSEASNLKLEAAVTGVVEEAAEDEAKEIEIKVKMGFT